MPKFRIIEWKRVSQDDPFDEKDLPQKARLMEAKNEATKDEGLMYTLERLE